MKENNKLRRFLKKAYHLPLALLISFSLASRLIYLYMFASKNYISYLKHLEAFDEIEEGRTMSILLNINELSDEEAIKLKEYIIASYLTKEYLKEGTKEVT